MTSRNIINNISTYLPPRYLVKILNRKMKNILILVSITVIAIIAIFIFSSIGKKNNSSVKSETTSTAVTIENDTQIINVTALSGGYRPSKVIAEAGKKTVLRLESKNSYGCERSFRIPKLGMSKILPQNGVTEFDLGTPESGENILGTCSMGMYTFTINFK